MPGIEAVNGIEVRKCTSMRGGKTGYGGKSQEFRKRRGTFGKQKAVYVDT
jgi:hypothetical protein